MLASVVRKVRAPAVRVTGSLRFFASPAPPVVASDELLLNFTTPHAPVYTKKVVDKVILPGVAGEYGITAGHSPIISELRPGVVSVVHTDVRPSFTNQLTPQRTLPLTESFDYIFNRVKLRNFLLLADSL